ncbi:MAG: hypothetical protein P8P35_06370, partial [Planktotalea sp.]|nr:hypothetical protein [Planktotalea sp.]
MGRFNWIWRTLQTLSVIACGIVWLPAQVLALGDAIPQSTTALGTCNVYREDNGEGFAFVSLGLPLFGAPLSGGYSYVTWGAGGVLSFGNDITGAIIANCLGVADDDVNLTVNIGAQANNYNTQTHIGFSFTLSNTAVTNDVNYLAGGTYSFYIGTPNTAPTANAGHDQTAVASGATVTLDGLGSTDTDAGDALTYAWTQTSGTTVTLSDTTAVQPTFTAPTLNNGDAAATLVFSLTVNDGTVDSTADTVSITVNPETASPASEFAAKEDAIRSVITSDAQRSLNNTLASNTRLTRKAR